jgi:DNA-binding MarR family transcriptional regulator
MSMNQDLVRMVRQWMESFTIRTMRSWTCYVKAVGMSMPQFSLLMHLYHRGEQNVRELGDRLAITSPGASQLIDRLVQAGLLRRTENPADRRSRRITLSDKGRLFVEKGIEERYQWVENLGAALCPAEQAALLQALPPLIAAEKKLGTVNGLDQRGDAC